MLKHAQEMLKVAKLVAADKTINAFRRDDMLFKAVSFMSDAYVQTGKKPKRSRAITELRKLAISIPSASLVAAGEHSTDGAGSVQLIRAEYLMNHCLRPLLHFRSWSRRNGSINLR